VRGVAVCHRALGLRMVDVQGDPWTSVGTPLLGGGGLTGRTTALASYPALTQMNGATAPSSEGVSRAARVAYQPRRQGGEHGQLDRRRRRHRARTAARTSLLRCQIRHRAVVEIIESVGEADAVRAYQLRARALGTGRGNPADSRRRVRIPERRSLYLASKASHVPKLRSECGVPPPVRIRRSSYLDGSGSGD